MSKIGKLAISLNQGVKVTLSGRDIVVSGSKGTLVFKCDPKINVKINENEIQIETKGISKTDKAIYGTTRSIIANMVKGVSQGWVKQLELVGTGYRAEVQGKTLVLTIGFSHPVKIEAPEGIAFKVEKNLITVEGIDKILVGQISANIRKVRPPEPYKGKGIKYLDEVVRRKPGKAAKGAGTGV